MEPLNVEQTSGLDLMAEVRTVLTSLLDAVEEQLIIDDIKIEQHLPRFITERPGLHMDSMPIYIIDSEDEDHPSPLVGQGHSTDCEGKEGKHDWVH